MHHLLAVGEVSVPYGEPGSGKSVLAEDIALHIAAGRPGWPQGETIRRALCGAGTRRRGGPPRPGVRHRAWPRRRAAAVQDDPRAARFPRSTGRHRDRRHDHRLAARYRCEAGLLIVDTVSARCAAATKTGRRTWATDRQPRPHPGRHRNPSAADPPPAGRKGTDARPRRVARRGRYHHPRHQVDNRPARRGGEKVGPRGRPADRVLPQERHHRQDEHGDPITAPVVVEASGARRRQKAELSGGQDGDQALQEAIDDLGVVPPAYNHIPPMTKAVTMDQWRNYAYRSASADRTNHGPRPAFDRAMNGPQAAKGHRSLGASCLD